MSKSRTRYSEATRAWLVPSLVPISLLTLWTLSSRFPNVATSHLATLPTPAAVCRALVVMMLSGQALNDAFWTLTRVMAGFTVGVGLGFGFGRLTGLHPIARRFLNATIQILRPVPAVALIPLVIALLGIGEVAKVAIVSWACFFPTWIATHSAVQRVPDRLLWTARTLGLSHAQVVRNVIIPWATPSILDGVRTGLGLSFAAVVVAEMSGAAEGLGYRITESQLVFRYDTMLAAIAMAGVAGFVIDKIFYIVVRGRFNWAYSGEI